MTIEEAIAAANDCGFEIAAPIDVNTLRADPAVRKMCAVNYCGRYNKSWSCPPACGTLEECESRLRSYKNGILVETVGDLEDEWDFESMIEIEKTHKARFECAVRRWRRIHSGSLLPLSAGSCTVCRKCTYPEAPCRFPDRQIQSMEAYCLLVSEVCTKNDLPYNHGKGKLAYVGCLLF